MPMPIHNKSSNVRCQHPNLSDGLNLCNRSPPSLLQVGEPSNATHSTLVATSIRAIRFTVKGGQGEMYVHLVRIPGHRTDSYLTGIDVKPDLHFDFLRGLHRRGFRKS